MAQRLKKIKVNEVSLVTRPAIAKEFLLYKSEDGAMEEPVVTEEIIKAETAEEVVKTEAESENVEKGKKDGKKPKEPKPVKKEEAEVEKKEEVCKECGKVHKAGEKCEVKKEAEPVVEDITKAYEALQIEKAAMAAKIAELEKAAFDAKQVEITKEFIAKADKELKHVPQVIPSKFGPVLKSASEKLTKEEYDAIYSALVGAEAIIKGSMLTKELGVGGEDLSAEPAQQLEAIAKSIQDKDPALTHAKAYTLACERNPQIYAEHVRASRRQ